MDVSIVIPAFNEAHRLPSFLNEVVAFCRKSHRTFEIIIVDDGSKDNTLSTAESFRTQFPTLHTIRLKRNRGKGYAVRQGLLKASGNVCLFMDADGSVHPDEIQKNIHSITEDGYDIFVGSRVLRGEGQLLKVRWYRKVPGIIFNFLVRALLFKEVQDTQCGFKMFRREVAGSLFSRGYLSGFGFDVEILYMAHRMGYKIKEGPVSWHHVRGSKFSFPKHSWEMFLNLFQIRFWHSRATPARLGPMLPQEYTYMANVEENHWWFVSRRRLVAYLMKSQHSSDPCTMLDVGSGTGGTVLALRKLGKVIGLEPSERAVASCRKLNLPNVVRGTAESLPFRESAFDLISCLDVLEHVTDPVRVLRELRRVVKDAGKIVLTVPAFRFLWSGHDEALGHLRRYGRRRLSIDVTEAELKIVRSGYFFFTIFFVVAPVRFLRSFCTRSQQEPHSDTTTLPFRPLNSLLKLLCGFELSVAARLPFPFGTTLYAILSKK